MAISPDGKSLYAGSSRRHRTGGFASYDRDPATGALTKRPGCFSATGARRRARPCRACANLYSLHVAPDGKNLYVVAQKLITTFDRDPATGNVTARTGSRRASRLTAIANDAANDNLCTAIPARTT